MSRTFVDASVFLYAQDPDNVEMRSKARQAVEAAQHAGGIATSYLVLDEVIWRIRRRLGGEDATRLGHQILATPGLDLLAIGRREAEGTLGLMAAHGLKPHDACHAATALAHGCTRILSTDPDFDRIKGLTRVGLDG